jgi:30S ribosomal protein S31
LKNATLRITKNMDMGRGDKKSRRGKISRGTFGAKRRKKGRKKAKDAAKMQKDK